MLSLGASFMKTIEVKFMNYNPPTRKFNNTILSTENIRIKCKNIYNNCILFILLISINMYTDQKY